jgi:hypothetical protein
MMESFPTQAYREDVLVEGGEANEDERERNEIVDEVGQIRGDPEEHLVHSGHHLSPAYTNVASHNAR